MFYCRIVELSAAETTASACRCGAWRLHSRAGAAEV